MFKKLNKKGFTLAELLVVVAIIGVLVAISIPIFTAQLEKSRDAVSIANIRAAYAEASTAYLTGSSGGNATVTKETNGTITNVKVSGVELKGTAAGWSGLEAELPMSGMISDDAKGGTPGKVELTFTWDTNDKCTVALGNVTA